MIIFHINNHNHVTIGTHNFTSSAAKQKTSVLRPGVINNRDLINLFMSRSLLPFFLK